MERTTEILKKIQENISPNNTRILSNTDGPPPELPPERFGGAPECPHCGGLGFVVPALEPSDPRFGRAVPCVCRAAELEAMRMANLVQVSQLGALSGCTFDSFLAEGHGLTRTVQRNLRMAYDLTLNYAQQPEGWLILKGGYGCGKTHLAAAVANHQLALGRPVLFINTPDLLDHLRAAYNPNTPTSYDERFEQVRNASLLILDDLGTQSNTAWAQEKLYQIFNYRYNARLPTVITTNEELDNIEIRVRSRMVDPSLTRILHILAPDFRRAGVAQDQSDLSTLELHTDQRFDNFDLRERTLTRTEAENLRRALETAKAFAEEPRGWLVLNSHGYGNGKTHLAAAIANEAAKRGESVLFVVVPDLLDHLRAAFNPAAGVPYDKRFKEAKTAPLLVLDDLGTESATPWVREKLYQIFNYRYTARLPTVITTATPIDEMDDRLRSRMLDVRLCTFFLLTAPSYKGGAQSRSPRKRRA